MVKKTHRIKKYLKKTKKRTSRGGKKLTPGEENADAIPIRTPHVSNISNGKQITPPRETLVPIRTIIPANTPTTELEKRLALLKEEDLEDLEDKTPVIDSPFHIPRYAKPELPFNSPSFESQDVVSPEKYDIYDSYSSTNDEYRESSETPAEANSFQVVGYDKHPFYNPRTLHDMTHKKLPILKKKVNVTIDAHGSVDRILGDNEKRLANHYLRVIELGHYDGMVQVYKAEYYKILNEALRNPSYDELFEDTRTGAELRVKLYKKLCPFIDDSRKPNCKHFSYNNRGDNYFRLVRLTHDRLFSGDREDIDIRENHPITPRTLLNFEHQGMFIPLPYNRTKTGMPYYTKEMFELFPGTTFFSKSTQISLVDTILPLAIERNERLNIFITSCNVSDILMASPHSMTSKSGISKFITTGKNFLFLISNLSQNIISCANFLKRRPRKGREAVYGIEDVISSVDPILTKDVVDIMTKVLICMRNTIFTKNYKNETMHKYNSSFVSHYFLGPIIPHSKWVPNELIKELNNDTPFNESENPKISELYAMAKLYLIQELVDNLGTTLEIAVSIMVELKKIYDLVIETINTYSVDDLMRPIELDFYRAYHSKFEYLFDFFDWIYRGIYMFYLPKLQNDKNNNKPIFRRERFINKPFYVKFLKLYKRNSLFFDQQTDFMRPSMILENVNPYKYIERVNIDELRDIMPGKDKFLSDSDLLKNKNKSKYKSNVSV
jgi:hypothetical protein